MIDKMNREESDPKMKVDSSMPDYSNKEGAKPESKQCFQRARTKEQIESRKNEIVNACAALYSKGGMDAVNFKAISEMTSFTRQSIYNYYKTKEEVLLDLLKREQIVWKDDMYEAMAEYAVLSKEDYALLMTSIFSDHGIMLELTGMLFNVIERNCRLEKLVEFRENSYDVYHILMVSVAKYFPAFPRESHQAFASTIFAFAIGLYPMNHMSKKHLEAERMADAFYVYPEHLDRATAFETQFYNGVCLLLSGM